MLISVDFRNIFGATSVQLRSTGEGEAGVGEVWGKGKCFSCWFCKRCVLKLIRENVVCVVFNVVYVVFYVVCKIDSLEEDRKGIFVMII